MKAQLVIPLGIEELEDEFVLEFPEEINDDILECSFEAKIYGKNIE